MMCVVTAVVLAGCAGPGAQGISYAMKTYDNVPITTFQFGGDEWRVFDKKAEHLMMITPSLREARRAGAKRGATLGASGPAWVSPEEFKPAAIAYLSKKGCQIESGRLVLRSQFEFSYSCN